MMCRWFSIGLATVLSFGASGIAWEGAFPLKAFVQETAAIRSGPSAKFYITQELNAGTEVEIFKTTDDGWCGLRPFSNSYSLIPSDAVDTTDSPDVVRLNREGIRTRVGSLITSDAHVKYVTLHKNEPVQSLGRTSDGKWIKIAPPSGEFRWIHKRFLGSKKPPTVSKTNLENRSQTESKVALATFDSEPLKSEPIGSGVVHQPNQGTTNSNSTPKSIDTDLVASARPIGGLMQTVPMVTEEPDTFAQADSTRPPTNTAPPQENAWQARDAQSPNIHVEAQANVITPIAASPPQLTVSPPIATEHSTNVSSLTSQNLNYEIGRINVALSGIVTQETNKWDLTDVRRRAERVVDSAQSPVDRQSGRELLKRIAEFENLQRRYDKMSGRSSRISSDSQDNLPDRMSAFHRAVAQRSSPVGSTSTRSSRHNSSKVDSELAAFLDSNNRTAEGRVQQASHSQPSLTDPTNRLTDDESNTGWLMPVVTSNPKMPKYAITDSEGKILCFVSPGSGVRLKSHLRQRVTLFGESGFNSNLNRRHLIATRVIAD